MCETLSDSIIFAAAESTEIPVQYRLQKDRPGRSCKKTGPENAASTKLSSISREDCLITRPQYYWDMITEHVKEGPQAMDPEKVSR